MKPIKLKLFGVPIMTLGSLPDAAPVPSTQTKFVSPRYEPSNITQNSTVKEIQAAFRSAEAGDTYNLFRYYRDVVLSDDHVQAEINTRKLATLSQPLAILPADKNNKDDVALAKAILQAKDDCENWDEGMSCLMDSHMFWPVSILERLYKPATEVRPETPRLQWTLKKFVPVNHQLECYQWAYLMGGVGLGTASAIQLANLAGSMPTGVNKTTPKPGTVQNPSDVYTIDLERWEPMLKLWPIDQAGRVVYDVSRADYLDPARHIVHRGHLLNFRDNWGGPGRCILMWYLLRQLGREWFAKGMEGYGQPFKVGYTDANDPVAVALLREAFDLSKILNGIVLDESSRMELEQTMVAGMSQGYETFYNMCNDAISKAISGMDRAAKSKGLNAGDNNMQQSVREDVRVYDQQRLGQTCVKQLAIPFRDLNGLRGNVKFIWGGLSDTDAKTFADLLQTMSQSGFEPTDDSIATINDRTGISWQRKAVPAPLLPGKVPAAPGNDDDTEDDDADDDTKTLAASMKGLRWLSATGRSSASPVDDVAARFVPALADAFRGANAPIREIILNSTSREDAEKKLKLFYADWKPERVHAVLEEALQICAAKGAVAGKAA